MKFQPLKTVLFSTALFTASACGTVVKLVDPTEPYSPYAGTKYDFEMAKRWGLADFGCAVVFSVGYGATALCVAAK